MNSFKEYFIEDLYDQKFGGTYNYVGCCVDLNGDDISDMVDEADQISWKEFYKYVDREDVEELFHGYGYDWSKRPKGLSLEKDWAVRTFRSKYKGKPCVYIQHSAIEYVFVGR